MNFDVAFQFLFWGYSLSGDVCEKGAIISENKNVEAIVCNAWDHGIEWLAFQLISYGDEEYHMPPEHWCLPGITDLRIHREKEFWKLVKEAT